MDAMDVQSQCSSEKLSKIVTILYMSHRIQAKVYHSDTLLTFMARIRQILPYIDDSKKIALYHLSFIKDSEVDIGNK